MRRILIFFVIATSLIGQTGRKRAGPKLSFEKLEKIAEKVASSNASDRLWAVKQAIRYNTDQTVEMVQERLLFELDVKIVEKILVFFAKRKSKKDFFYILDFLKANSRPKYAKMALEIMYKISAARTRYELNILFQKNYGRVHSLTYFKVPTQVTPRDRAWFQRVYKAHRLADFWAKLPKRFDQEIVIGFNKFYDTKLQYDSLAHQYWLIKANKPITKSISMNQIEDFPRHRRRELLDALYKSTPQNVNASFLLSRSSLVVRWAIRNYLLHHVDDQTWSGKFKKIIKKVKVPSILFTISTLYSRLNAEEKNIWKNRCSNKSIEPQLCMRVILIHEPSRAYTYWRAQSENVKEDILAKNTERILKNKDFNTTAFLRYVFGSEDPDLKLRVAFFMPKNYYSRHSGLISSYWLVMNHSTLKLILLSRMLQISKKYENYIAMVEHFKIPEFEKKPKKSGADTNAVNPTAQNENKQNENNKINTLNVNDDNNPKNRTSTLPRITPDQRENKIPTLRPR